MAANIELPIDVDILKQLRENHYAIVDEFLREYLLLCQTTPLKYCIFYEPHNAHLFLL